MSKQKQAPNYEELKPQPAMKVQFGLEGAGPVETHEVQYLTIVVGDNKYRVRIEEMYDGKLGLHVNKTANKGMDFQIIVVPRSSNVVDMR